MMHRALVLYATLLILLVPLPLLTHPYGYSASISPNPTLQSPTGEMVLIRRVESDVT